jgi:lipopolysaccharide export LptBFGC system permease protein LptF
MDEVRAFWTHKRKCYRVAGGSENWGKAEMKTRLNFIVSFAVALLVGIVAAIEPALAQQGVPGPIIGAGLPVLAVFGGAYWLVRKLRKPRL